MTPSASGTLGATPLAHALVYARNRRLSGRLELTHEDRKANIALWNGSITSVDTVPLGLCPGGYFGAVVYELGYIDSGTLDATLLEIAKSKRLHGEILLERKAITAAQRDEALVEQIHRKIHHLFSFPDDASYAFWDTATAGVVPSVAVDPVGPVWRGVRDYPPERFVKETIRRVGGNALKAMTGGSARLPPAETKLTQALFVQPMTLDEMKAASDLPPARVELLVYLLVIAKCVESVAGVRTHPSTGALPTSMPSGPVRIDIPPGEIPPPPSSGRLPPPSSARIPVARPASASPFPPQPISSPLIEAGRRISSTKIPAQNVRPSAPAGTLAALKTPAEYGLDGIRARAETIEDENYFEVLGVSEGASAEAVRAAFMRLAKTWHPDKLVTDFHPVRTEVAKIFTHMNRAQKTLCDPDERRQYTERRSARAKARPRNEVLRELEQALQNRLFDLAMIHAESLIQQDSDDAEALALHAWATVRAGDANEDELRAALSKLDKAVNVDRTCDEAVYHRGLVHKRLGNTASAFRDFARAVQLNPKHLGAEREVRLYAMRVKKGSGEHKLVQPILEKLDLDVRKK